MKNPITPDEVLEHLHQQFPQLIIENTLYGYVTGIDENTVYACITLDDEEEYDAQLHKHIFPKEDLAENIYFFIVVGKINHKEFTHVNYFYWTQEQLDKAKEQAEDLYELLELKSKIKPGRLLEE